jgi:hypothetical protein
MSRYAYSFIVVLMAVGLACEPVNGPQPPPSEPPVPPSGPEAVRAVAEVGGATLTWSIPAEDGGSAITGYQVDSEPREATLAVQFEGTRAHVTGLRAGATYRFSVVAVNVAGAGPATSSEPITLPDVPGAPTEVKATADVLSARVSWEAPAQEGGSAITGYIVEVQPTGTRVRVAANPREATVSELPSTGTYTFTVSATNGVGTGAVSSASSPVRPLKAPARVKSLEVPASPDGCLSVSYTLQQPEGERADVLMEVDAKGDGTFQRLTQAGSTDHEGLLARSTSPRGVAHRFLWNRAVDVPGATSVHVRVSTQVRDASPDSKTVKLALPPLGRGCELWMDSSRVSSTLMDALRMGTVGDFDRDAKPDLIVVPDYGPMLMLKGLGNGGFQPDLPLELGFSMPRDFPPVAADLDGDGALDLLWTDYDQNLFVARGLGDGSFTTALQYDTGTNLGFAGSQSNLIVADFDGNGSPDVAMVRGYGSLGLLLNQGDGTLGAFQSLATEWAAGGRLATADLDEDGRQDLVATSYGSVSAVLLSNGDGTFRTQRVMGTDSVLDSVLGDFDQDGHVDKLVAVLRSTVELSLLRGDGLGGFSEATLVASLQGTPNGFSPAILAADDLDGDGQLDLAVTIEQDPDLTVHNTLVLLKGLGDGTFSPGVRLPSGRRPHFVTTGDFDGNGASDVATLQWESRDVRVWMGDPGRTTRALPIGSVGPSAVGDFNGDGWTDVVSAMGDPATPVARTQVQMSLGGPEGLSTPVLVTTVDSVVVSLGVAHVDADATLDVVLFDSSQPAGILLGKGDGTLRPSAELSLGSLVDHVESGDVNEDGKPDLVLSAVRKTDLVREVRLLISRGDGTFEPPLVLADGDSEGQVVLADLDRDGKLDVVVPQAGNGMGAKVLMGKGDGSFTSGPDLSIEDDFSGGRMRLADLDQDGVLDAVFCRDGYKDNMPWHILHVLKGTGTGRFTRVGTYPTQAQCLNLTLVDLDADGWRDVLYSNPLDDSVSVLQGAGQGVLAAERRFGIYEHDEHGIAHLSVLDANGDGRLDLLGGGGIFRWNSVLLQR